MHRLLTLIENFTAWQRSYFAVSASEACATYCIEEKSSA